MGLTQDTGSPGGLQVQSDTGFANFVGGQGLQQGRVNPPPVLGATPCAESFLDVILGCHYPKTCL